MKKENTVRVMSFLIAAVIVSAGFLVKMSTQNKRYRLELQNGYSRSLDDFGAALGNISVTLSKARFVTTPEQLSTISATLLTEAETSKSALAQLPQNEELTVLNRFLSQVGNYAMSVSKSLINGDALSQEASENIELLAQTAEKISQLVNNSQISYNNAEYWASELDQELEQNIDSDTLASSLGELEEELSDFPTLVYDGPYSDHILEKEPTMIVSAEPVSDSEALEQAAKSAETDKKNLSADGVVTGTIPAYRFIGNGITVNVSKSGGYTVYMCKERAVSTNLLSFEQAVEKAKRYLSRMGMDGFIQTYYALSEGVCVVNFAFVDGETICYTDLIKVGVAMDNGEIMLYEASGYLSNHQSRAFETPAYTLEQAEALVSDKLTIQSSALALIPTSAANEVRCYEFACTSADGQDILVFINTMSLTEERILILLKTDGGTLVK